MATPSASQPSKEPQIEPPPSILAEDLGLDPDKEFEEKQPEILHLRNVGSVSGSTYYLPHLGRAARRSTMDLPHAHATILTEFHQPGISFVICCNLLIMVPSNY
jgi:hypothetical protein